MSKEEKEWLRNSVYRDLKRAVQAALDREREAQIKEQKSRYAALEAFKRLRRSIRDNPAYLKFFGDVENGFVNGLPELQLTASMESELPQLEKLWATSHWRDSLTAEEKKHVRVIVFMVPAGIGPGYDSYVDPDERIEFQKVKQVMERAEENRRERERTLRPKPAAPVQTFQPQSTEFRKTYHPFDDVNRDRRGTYGNPGSGVNVSQYFSGGNNSS